jgi:hypothetical protein
MRYLWEYGHCSGNGRGNCFSNDIGLLCLLSGITGGGITSIINMLVVFNPKADMTFPHV